MHREHAALREQVIQHGENGLLDLSCVTRPADENEPGLKLMAMTALERTLSTTGSA